MTRSPRTILMLAVLILVVGARPLPAAASLPADEAQGREGTVQTADPSSTPGATASPTGDGSTPDPQPTASRTEGAAPRDDETGGAREDPSQQSQDPSPTPDAGEAAPQPAPRGQDRAAAPQAPPAVSGPIGEYWHAHSQTTGQPTGAQTPVNGGVYQRFERGVVYWSGATGAHFVSGDVLGAFGRYGWQGGFLGFPTSDEVAGKGGAYQRFAGGVIYRGPGGAHPVWGDMLSAYGRNGWQDGAMGYPIGDVTGTPGGVYQRFERGVAYWSGATGAHFVSGDVLGAFGRYGWQGGFLGFPTSDEVAGKGGAYQRFAGGVIYRGPGGAHPVWGDMLSAYGRNGWQDGAMGYPIGDVTGTPGGVYQRFERGVAYWSGATGAHFVTGRFLGRYGADGWQGGARGFPKTDEYVDRGVVRQDFQHGSYWDGPMPAGLYSHGIVQPAGQPNGYFCGPTAGYTVLSNLGAWQSAATGEPLSIGALAGPQYMNTVGYGYTSFNDRRFEYGMNTWLGRTTYYTLHAPSVDQVLTSVMHSYETGYPTVVDEQERRGGPHFNNHSNSTFSHIMVVDSYDSSTGAVSFVDPGYTLWGGAQAIFWYPSLSTFTRNHLQNEVINDGKQHIGIYTS